MYISHNEAIYETIFAVEKQ